MHLIFHSVILVENIVTVTEQQFACVSQLNLASHPVKEPYLIIFFQFLNVFTYCRLTDKKFLCRFCEAEIICYAAKYFKSEVNHLPTNFKRCNLAIYLQI